MVLAYSILARGDGIFLEIAGVARDMRSDVAKARLLETSPGDTKTYIDGRRDAELTLCDVARAQVVSYECRMQLVDIVRVYYARVVYALEQDGICLSVRMIRESDIYQSDVGLIDIYRIGVWIVNYASMYNEKDALCFRGDITIGHGGDETILCYGGDIGKIFLTNDRSIDEGICSDRIEAYLVRYDLYGRTIVIVRVVIFTALGLFYYIETWKSPILVRFLVERDNIMGSSYVCPGIAIVETGGGYVFILCRYSNEVNVCLDQCTIGPCDRGALVIGLFCVSERIGAIFLAMTRGLSYNIVRPWLALVYTWGRTLYAAIIGLLRDGNTMVAAIFGLRKGIGDFAIAIYIPGRLAKRNYSISFFSGGNYTIFIDLRTTICPIGTIARNGETGFDPIDIDIKISCQIGIVSRIVAYSFASVMLALLCSGNRYFETVATERYGDRITVFLEGVIRYLRDSIYIRTANYLDTGLRDTVDVFIVEVRGGGLSEYGVGLEDFLLETFGNCSEYNDAMTPGYYVSSEHDDIYFIYS